MSTSTSKKALVLRFDREPLPGFVNPQNFATPSGIELLTPQGQVLVLPFSEVKLVCFVKDFSDSPNVFEKRQFAARPKTLGLWVRLKFRDGELLEGLLSSNLLQIEQFGFTVAPPDPTLQRIFVPRAALTDLEVLGVIGSALRKLRARPVSQDQLQMFE